MRILVLSQYWHPENGVPQRRWAWLTDILREAGHDVFVVAPPPHYKRSITLREWVRERGFSPHLKAESGPSGETILRTGYFPSGRSLTRRIFNQGWNAASMMIAIARKSGPLSEYKPDLVIGTVPALPTAGVIFFAAKRFRAPYIVDLRDAWPALFKESGSWNVGTGKPSIRERFFTQGPFQALVFITELMLNVVLKHASGILTTSTKLESQLFDELGIPTATVRNVFPIPNPPASLSVSRDDHEELRVVYAGTLGRAQKLENALLAAHLVETRGLPVSLRFIGDGATWDALEARAKELDLQFSLNHQRSPEQLLADYEWADTALVHLTDWESLKVAVPSKTYELMSNGLHISGVAWGETAELITALRAGDVVEPNNPEALAQLWIELAQDRTRLCVSGDGLEWVRHQRDEVSPEALVGLIAEVVPGA